jgi:hypothetical protein
MAALERLTDALRIIGGEQLIMQSLHVSITPHCLADYSIVTASSCLHHGSKLGRSIGSLQRVNSNGMKARLTHSRNSFSSASCQQCPNDSTWGNVQATVSRSDRPLTIDSLLTSPKARLAMAATLLVAHHHLAVFECRDPPPSTLPQRYHELLASSVAAHAHGTEFLEAAAAHPSSVVWMHPALATFVLAR